MENEKIYLDKKGYEKLLRDISSITEQLENLRKNKADAYENGGDGFHDNFAFEDSERNERMLIKILSEKVAFLGRVVLVDSHEDENVVNVNDLVSLTINFGDDEETDTYRLIGTADSVEVDGVINVSLNSPLGKAIYLKSVNSFVNYAVGNNNYLVHINSKIDENEFNKPITK